MEIVFLVIVLLIVILFFMKRIGNIKSEISFEDSLKTIVDNEKFFYKEFSLKNDEGSTFTGKLIFGKSGIFFVNEYENLTGSIYGDDDKFYWTQVLEHRKLNIANPVISFRNFSNEFKIKYSRDFSNLKIYFIHCFSKKCRIKVKSHHSIIYTSDFKDTIEKYKDEIFSDEEMKVLMEILIQTGS